MAWKAYSKSSPSNDNSMITPTKSNKANSTLLQIAKIEKQRESRRKAMAAAKVERQRENLLNEKMGSPGDVDFQRMIKSFRLENAGQAKAHTLTGAAKINICVRKRPVNNKEIKRKDHDSITCLNPSAIVHDCKLRVDGITKYLDNNRFAFDHTFDETSTTEEVYKYTAQSLIPFILNDKGKATVFAYGQTGSGKTHTMEGIQRLAVQDIIEGVNKLKSRSIDLEVYASFFEIYGGRCQDLLHDRKRLIIMEDGKGEAQITGLEECEAKNASDLLQLIERGNKLRTTHATEVNDQSSRSHGICQICLREPKTKKLYGKLSLIDLAGSERGADTKSHNRQRRLESAEINKSLLALKECIRALDSGGAHIPYRASKLTLVLKDSFSHANAKTVMIAAVSPCASSADHTVNTLRYADRVKEKDVSNYEDGKSPYLQANIIDPTEIELEASDYDFSPVSSPDKPETNLTPSTNEQLKLQPSNSREDNINEDVVTSLEHFHETVQSLYEEEENLLTEHISSIQVNASLLTEEGDLLARIQGHDVVDYDIDEYATRLDEILGTKMEIITSLRKRLSQFRKRLQEEENISQKMSSLPLY